MVMVSKEQLSQLQANLDRVEALYRETQVLYDEGFVEKLDVERLEINRNNLNAEIGQVEALIPVSEDLLKFYMGMPVSEQLELVADLESFPLSGFTDDLSSAYDPTERLEYKVLEKQRALETLNMRRYRVDFLPNLYAFGNYAWNWQWDSEQNFSFETGAAGIQINVPIFDSFQKSNQIKKAKFEVEKITQDMEQFRNNSDREYRQAVANLNNALSRLESQAANRQLAEKVYNVSRIKYTEGVGSSLEVNEAETQLKQAESLYLNSLLEYILAKLDLEKLNGTFRQY